MGKNSLITPEGTRDFLFEESFVRRQLEEQLHRLFAGKGYSQVMTPGIEFYDVFQSASYPGERLYKMTDSKNRLLVMRPETTTPIARMVATRLKSVTLPLRMYYYQSAYRFEQALKGRSDEITQTGIELLGSAGYMADVEMVTTAMEALEVCGGEGGYTLELGDAGLYKELIKELGVSSAQQENIRYLIETKNYPMLEEELNSLGECGAADSLKKLPRMFGGEEVFQKASRLYGSMRMGEMLADLERLYQDLKSVCKGRLTVDLGLVNNVDYYTGVIIKGYLEGYGEEVLSGGRYNKLLGTFGYDIPATGFAINVDAAAKVLLKTSPVGLPSSDVLVHAAKGYEMKAVEAAKRLRKQGQTVEFSLFEDVSLAREYAAERGIGKIVFVNETEGT